MAEADWTRICEHVCYRIDGQKITVRAEGDYDYECLGKIYQSLTDGLADGLLLLKERDAGLEAFEAIISNFGHTLLRQCAVNNMALILACHHGPLPLELLAAAPIGTLKVLEACSKVAELEIEARRQVIEEEERLRKLFGEEH